MFCRSSKSVLRRVVQDIAVRHLRTDQRRRGNLFQAHMLAQRLGVDHSPVFADEEFLRIGMANESVLEVDAVRIGVMHGQAIISRLSDIFEDDIGRGVRQVMLHEAFTADRFLDDPRRTFAVKERHELQERGFSLPVSARDNAAAMQRHFDDPSAREGIDQNHAGEAIRPRVQPMRRCDGVALRLDHSLSLRGL
jgi:hypothetical protein